MRWLAEAFIIVTVCNSSTPFLYQLFYSLLFIITTIHSWYSPPNFLNSSSEEHSLFFSQNFPHRMPLLRTMQLVQLLHHIDYISSLHLSRIPYFSAHFSALPTLYTPRTFCVPDPFQILHPLPLGTQVIKTIHFINGPAFNRSTHIYIPGAPHNFTLTHIHLSIFHFHSLPHSSHTSQHNSSFKQLLYCCCSNFNFHVSTESKLNWFFLLHTQFISL